MKKVWLGMGAAASAALLGACSEDTQEKALTTAEKAAADTEANAEVVGTAIRQGTADAADAVSTGAENLSEQLDADAANDPDPGDGQLDGTD